MGKYEKAKELANNQNSIIVCKELLLPLAAVGDEKAKYQGERIMVLLSELDFAINEALSLRPTVSSSKYAKQILLSIINLYETVFVDGKCGRWHSKIGHLYLRLTHYESSQNGASSEALSCFDQGFQHYKEYVRIYNEGNYSYTAPLVSNLKELKKGDLASVDMGDFWKKQLKNYPQNILDELRKNPKYAECFE